MLSYNPLRSVLVYTILIMTLFCVPSYFAIQSTIMEEKYKATQEILEWVEAHEKSIFAKESFDIPRSVRFHLNIYDDAHKLMYQGIQQNFDDLNFKVRVIYPFLYYQKEIKTDTELVFLVVEMQLNYAKIIFVTTMLFFIVLFLVYLMSNLFVNSSIYPYQKMQRYMNDFFNDSMHELKTPLGVININVELLSSYVTSSKHLQRIKAATKQMQMTYEDVEYYIKHKKLVYAKEPINLSEYLGLRIAFFEDIAVSKSIVLEYEIEPDMMIYISKVELQRIIDNTLSNAIKYSFFQGKVEINLARKDDEHCVLCFHDYGQGIKDLYKVFQRFEREDSVQGGFGLGLNIVQNICNKNDIDIEIESYENKGSRFTYIFKLDKKKLLDTVDNEATKGEI
ncbi:sensor histidine kinase [Sulfurospirillum oryzae]|uniref:sensor histidine kinase n=1 Tax=Sulfurospirillum oryzae TaxID=2976535 RepID=UPI0021E76F38|nr:HAMP domain-containing sensor histidine kinase [Sulfurospirillum oryzae]